MTDYKRSMLRRHGDELIKKMSDEELTLIVKQLENHLNRSQRVRIGIEV